MTEATGEQWGRRFEAGVGARIRALREARGLSTTALADGMTRLGVPVNQSTMSKYERGVIGIGLAQLTAAAVVLETSPAVLLVDLEADEVEVAPGRFAGVVDAVEWWAGRQTLPAAAYSLEHAVGPLVLLRQRAELLAVAVRLAGVNDEVADAAQAHVPKVDAQLAAHRWQPAVGDDA
ncbi:helix-turn-helix domain-containing protein [Demequina pelophila]|uniref:helix-turn-helix domain-containing protein n=1 Tax=Demequina pelophila TaxID=1638984 RepID=UPI000781C922|nr:helix-turn-helix transcriptional regulator [Demequina pelophila]